MIYSALVLVFFTSLLLTASLRKYALSRSMIDVPNERSSHSNPTPRGGGVSIVITVMLSFVGLYFSQTIDFPTFISLFLAGGLVAVIGFMDDHGHIAARWRLLGHFLAAAIVLFWTGGLPAIDFFGLLVDLQYAGYVFALFYLVWMLNLYNFMDGIDGLASVEAICACLGMCVVYQVGGHTSLIPMSLLFAVAVAGFMYWNFPAAKIFMGDAGSGFIGIVLAAISLQAAQVSADLLWCWLILLGVFVVDATVTLFRRLLRGARVYEAHRSHAYQYASRRVGRHAPVTLAVGLINVFWLLPLAVCVAYSLLSGAMALVIAYAPLIFLAVRFRAGQSEEQCV
ncbi:MraY family glycosyltransferase [Pseudomonas poae]|uniref:Glycosyl transferase n=1 Tax=Pseudomonas poae TaxID=200451 RepID=A0A2S9ETP4_9PSED|nr:glycosyltransferase family 4 protein [Pseudomonas poae]PRA28242.1 glycosyl transferase [Pseudomonas poae]PRC19235.1 glycosyl transferase [Pseudomonas poae]